MVIQGLPYISKLPLTTEHLLSYIAFWGLFSNMDYLQELGVTVEVRIVLMLVVKNFFVSNQMKNLSFDSCASKRKNSRLGPPWSIAPSKVKFT